MAARSSAPRARWRWCSQRTSATRSRCPESSLRRSVRPRSRTSASSRPISARAVALRSGTGTANPCRSTSPATSWTCSRRRVTRSMRSTLTSCARAYDYLERALAAKPPENEGWWPSYTAWQAFAVKVLVEGGRNQDSNINRLYGYRERMPVFALAYLHDALLARAGRAGARRRRADRRAAAPHGERHPSRGRHRARRGAERSVPALVLELKRAIDRHRAGHARAWSGAERAAPAPPPAQACGGTRVRPSARWSGG